VSQAAAALLVGIDIGGTKTHVRAAPLTDTTPVVDAVVPSAGWRPRPEDGSVEWVDGLLADVGIAPDDVRALVVGAHGYDTNAQAATMAAALAASRPYPCDVLNDALLLPAAAGLPDGVGLIVGTGSIAVGRASDGEVVYAGGWGYLLGDEGSAPSLVRDAVRAVLRNHELGRPDDELARRLVESMHAGEVMELPERLRHNAGAAAWGAHAPEVFAAVAAGSELAMNTVREAGGQLAELVRRLRLRGVPARDVVAAGGVVVGQESLQAAIAAALRGLAPEVRFHVLRQPPVVGAVRLAASLGAPRAHELQT
jgi:N-acetylglucosamine kinase-like BadF-type ATPase